MRLGKQGFRQKRFAAQQRMRRGTTPGGFQTRGNC
jgi:hypothetical protein